MIADLTLKTTLRFCIPAATAAATVGGGAYFLIPKSGNKPSTDNQQQTEQIPARQQEKQQQHITKASDFDVDFMYVVAELSEVDSSLASADFDLHAAEYPFVTNFVCKLQDSDTAIDACRLFALSEGEDANTINLQHTKEVGSSIPNTLIKKASDFKNGNHVVLRFSKNKKDAFMGSVPKPINIFKKDDQTKKMATLTYLFDLNKNHFSRNLTIDTSSLILVKVSEAATGDITADESLNCQFNKETAIPCKIYKLASQPESLSTINKSTFNDLSASITQQADLAKDTYILIDLLNQKKAISDLEIADIEIQKADGTKVAKAFFTDILVGKVDSTNPAKSIIYPVEKTAHHYSEENTQYTANYFVTSAKHIFDDAQIDWTKFPSQLACKVTSRNRWFIDEHCKLYDFDVDSYKSYLLDNVELAHTPPITKEKITSSKQQLIHFSQNFLSRLAHEEDITIELINKEAKSHYWGNKFAIFKNVLPIHNFKKSRLAIARVKESNGTSTEITSDTLTCVLKDGKQVSCKVYDFKDPKFTNNIDKSTLNEVTPWNKTVDDLKKDRLFLLEFIKDDNFDLLVPETQNTFELKFSQTKLVDMEIDQLVFGNIKSTPKDLFTKKGKTALYIVELSKDSTGWTTVNLATDYRCVYQTGNTKKYDDSCKVVALPEYTGSNKLITYDELLALRNSESTRLTTISDVSKRYALIVDEGKIDGINEGNISTSTIKIEQASTVSNSANQLYATANLKHKIEDELALGLPEYIVAKLETGSSTTPKNSCTWSTLRPEVFTCQPFDQVTQNESAWKTTAFNKSPLSATDSLSNKKIILFKVTGTVDGKTWRNKNSLYFFNSSDTGSINLNQTGYSFTLKAIMAGNNADGQKMYELCKKNA